VQHSVRLERASPPSPPSPSDLDHSLTPDDDGVSPGAKVDAPRARLDERYEELGVLGSGGSGVVLLGHDRATSTSVAIKRLRRPSPVLVQRLLREASLIASLDHPGIVRLQQVVRTETDEVALVLEHVAGPDLETVVRTEGALSLARALQLARDVARALAHAHARGVIHRDVKPSNILLAPGDRPKVTDFGLALPLLDPNSLALTGTDVCGTLDYMAPEQRTDAHEVDGRADVYGLGATLYRLVTGSSPRVIRERSLPEPAREVVLRCVEEDPAARYASMEELERALGDGLERLRRRVWSEHDPAKRDRTRRLPVAAAGLVALGLLPQDAPERLRRRLEAGASLEDEVPRLVAHVLGCPRVRAQPELLVHAHVTLFSALIGCELERAGRWAMHKLARATREPTRSRAAAERLAAAVGRLTRHGVALEHDTSAHRGAEQVLEQVIHQLRVQALSASPRDWPVERARWKSALRELAIALPEPHLASRIQVELLLVDRDRRASPPRRQGEAA
jgi:hypothetical protein